MPQILQLKSKLPTQVNHDYAPFRFVISEEYFKFLSGTLSKALEMKYPLKVISLLLPQVIFKLKPLKISCN